VRGLGSSGSRSGTVAGFCEHGNEPSCSIKSRMSLQLFDYQFIMKDFIRQC
jgi:hypothetical protein